MAAFEQSYRAGNGPVGVLLLHGLTGSPAELRYVANGLAREGYTVHCPLIAGHGGSTTLLKESRWQDWYKSAESALAELSRTCETVIVGGLSTGAVLSLMLAADHPDKVRGLTLFAPTLWLTGKAVPWYARLFKLVNMRWLANLFRFPLVPNCGIKCPRIRDFVQAAAAKEGAGPLGYTPGVTVLERDRLVAAALRRLPAIDQPALIVHPREDSYAGLDNAWHLQGELKGPVDLCVLDDSDHFVTVDRQRDVVLKRSAAFARELAARTLSGTKATFSAVGAARIA